MSNLDIWKRLVIHLKKISKTLVKYLKWTYLVNRNKLENDNVWEILDDIFQGFINYLINWSVGQSGTFFYISYFTFFILLDWQIWTNLHTTYILTLTFDIFDIWHCWHLTLLTFGIVDIWHCWHLTLLTFDIDAT